MTRRRVADAEKVEKSGDAELLGPAQYYFTADHLRAHGVDGIGQSTRGRIDVRTCADREQANHRKEYDSRHRHPLA